MRLQDYFEMMEGLKSNSYDNDITIGDGISFLIDRIGSTVQIEIVDYIHNITGFHEMDYKDFPKSLKELNELIYKIREEYGI